MTRLLWKEFRERRLWALVWAVAILGVSLFGQGQAFCGERELFFRPGLWVPVLLAVLVGAGTYAGELIGDRATFTFSRPIDWRALLAAKLLFGAILVFGTPLLAALCFRLSSPAAYHPLMTPAHVLVGVWGVGWKLGAGYLFGLACSVVKPGFAGGMMTVTATFLGLLVLEILLVSLVVMPYYSTHPDANPFGGFVNVMVPCLAAWVAALCAAAPITRFGLTQGVDVRIKRFALTYGVVLLGIGALGIAVPKGWMDALLLRWVPATTIISPSGKYALVGYDRNPFGWHILGDYGEMGANPQGRRAHIIRLSDGVSVMELTGNDAYAMTGFKPWHWVSDDCAYFHDYDIQTRRQWLCIVHPSARAITRIGTVENRQELLSPDSAHLLRMQYLGGVPKRVATKYTLSVIDLATAREHTLGTVAVDNAQYGSPWWQNNAEIGYQNEQKERRMIRLSEP